jgi:electron-transferring-flavoprotein dehydrogenase
VPKIKGTHTAMKSGMVAARRFEALAAGGRPPVLDAYPAALRRSWVWDELQGVRNIRPASRSSASGAAGLCGARHLRAARQGALDVTHHADHETC